VGVSEKKECRRDKNIQKETKKESPSEGKCAFRKKGQRPVNPEKGKLPAGPLQSSPKKAPGSKPLKGKRSHFWSKKKGTAQSLA